MAGRAVVCYKSRVPLADPGSKTVLIVDDDESVLNLLEILVRRDGFKVELADNGDAALEKLKLNPDALLLDLMLPGTTTGFEVLRRLRALGRPVPPTIIVTAYFGDPVVKKLQEDPSVITVLPKPVNQERLLSALHKALNTKAPERKKGGPPPKEQKP